MSDQEDSDTRAFVDDIMENRKPLTVDTCYEYRELGGEDMLLGYKDSVYGSTAAIQRMLKTTNNYHELKAALSNFVSQQKDLLVYIYDTWPGEPDEEPVDEYRENFEELKASNQAPSISSEVPNPPAP